jgi:uncharacterized RmlC-like cupin family protein
MSERESAVTCRVVRGRDTYQGKQGLQYFEGISAQSVGSKALCMHLVEVPPGARTKAHRHEQHETAIYVLRGVATMWYGERLAEHMVVGKGDFVYVPAGLPHLVTNASESETCTVVLARTDPNEQESVVLMPELEGAIPA